MVQKMTRPAIYPEYENSHLRKYELKLLTAVLILISVPRETKEYFKLSFGNKSSR